MNKLITLCLIATVVCHVSVAQKKIRLSKPSLLEIDLSIGSGSSTEKIVDPGDYEVVVLNQLSSMNYTVTFEKTNKLPIALPFPAQSTTESLDDTVPDACKDIETALTAIKEATDEKELGVLVAKVTRLINQAEARLKKSKKDGKKGDKDGDGQEGQDVQKNDLCPQSFIDNAKALLNELNQKVEKIYSLKPNQSLKVTVTRLDDNGKTLKWEVIYSTEDRVVPIITYGWSGYSAKWPNREYTYFLKEIPPAPLDPQNPDPNASTQTLYQVTKSNADTDWYPVASIMLSYRPVDATGATFRPVFGLGTNASSVNFLFGGQLLIHSNYAIATGFNWTSQKVLNGKYRENDLLSVTLTDEQLHDQRFVPKFFVGISLRFNENPRGGSPK